MLGNNSLKPSLQMANKTKFLTQDSHSYKNQTKILTTKKQNFGEWKWISIMMDHSFPLSRDAHLNKNSSFFSYIAEGRRRGHSYIGTMVHNKHHGWTMVLARTKLSALLLFHGHNISGASMRSQYTLRWGSNDGPMIQIPANIFKQPYPSIKWE